MILKVGILSAANSAAQEDVSGDQRLVSSRASGSTGRYEPGLHLFGKLDQFRRGFLRENMYEMYSIS